MHEVKINNTLIRIPASWDELNIRYLRLIAGQSYQQYTEMQFKTDLLFFGAGIYVKRSEIEKDPENRQEDLYKVKLSDLSIAYMTSSQITALCNLFDFLFRVQETDKGERKVSIDSHLTKNLIPTFKVSGVTYFGPSEKLFNITLSEFIHAETNLTRYKETKQVDYLDKVIAILYRPENPKYNPDSPDFNGDRRIPFNDHRFEERARKICRMNHNLKICIFLFYTGCQWWYQQQFPHVFSHKSNKSGNNLGFLNLVDALTAGDVTKTDQIRETLLMDVMVHMERAAIEFEEMERKMKKK